MWFCTWIFFFAAKNFTKIWKYSNGKSYKRRKKCFVPHFGSICFFTDHFNDFAYFSGAKKLSIFLSFTATLFTRCSSDRVSFNCAAKGSTMKLEILWFKFTNYFIERLSVEKTKKFTWNSVMDFCNFFLRLISRILGKTASYIGPELMIVWIIGAA